MEKYDRNERLILEGDRVLITKTDTKNSTELSEFFLQNKVYGVVRSEKEHDFWYYSRDSVLLNFKATGLTSDTFMSYKTECLEVIPKEKYPIFDELVNKAKLEVERLKKEVYSIPNLPSPELNFQMRTFNYSDKLLLCTNHNFVECGRWDKNEGRNAFHVTDVVYEKKCCSFTNTTEDLQVYIPKLWMDYYGYSRYDLVSWLEFLAKCEIGFEYEFYGNTGLSDRFDPLLLDEETLALYKKQDRIVGDYCIKFEIGNNSSKVTPLTRKDYYCIRLKASDNDHVTYLRFICLRYIYNDLYWTIPGHAMQIKRALGEYVTHFQALLMAQLHYTFDGYYSIGNQIDIDPDKPHVLDPNVDNRFSVNKNNYDRHLYPFQKPEVFLNRLKTGIGPNLAAEYICDTYKREELNDFFRRKDYIGLYLYLNSKEEEKNEKQWHLLIQKN